MISNAFCRRETVGLLRGAPPYHRSNSQNTTKDILELKDHLVQVERAVSKSTRKFWVVYLRTW